MKVSRYHTDAPVACVLDNAADLFLGIVKAVGAFLLQQGKSLALHSEALIFRQVPMEDVELYRLHAVERAIDHIQQHEMTTHIQHQSPPGKAWLIVDGYRGNGEASRGDSDELQEGLQAVQHAERIGGFEVNFIRRDLQMIGLVFFQLLNGCTGTLGLNEELRFVEAGFAPERDSGLPR